MDQFIIGEAMGREVPGANGCRYRRFSTTIKLRKSAARVISAGILPYEACEDLPKVERVWLVLWITDPGHQARHPAMILVKASFTMLEAFFDLHLLS